MELIKLIWVILYNALECHLWEAVGTNTDGSITYAQTNKTLREILLDLDNETTASL